MGRPRSCDREAFVVRAVETHKNKYNYDKSIFVSLSHKVEISCNDCGYIFMQYPYRHLKGNGCRKCANKKLADVKRLTFDEFKARAIKIHNNAFDYSKSIYTNTSNKIEIVHKICNRNFMQRPSDHLYGSYGCQFCARINNRTTKDDFIKKAIEIHSSKFNYNLVKYITTDTKIKIGCSFCGKIFEQTPHAHLNGQGCYDCSVKKLVKNFSSIAEKEWLDSLKISIENRQKSIIAGNKRYLVDAFNPITNEIFEFYGDFFHGNPIIFNPEKRNGLAKTTFGELYRKTLEKEEALKNAGYNVISMWEDDWNIQTGKRRNIRNVKTNSKSNYFSSR